jgi:hypothetical protein
MIRVDVRELSHLIDAVATANERLDAERDRVRELSRVIRTQRRTIEALTAERDRLRCVLADNKGGSVGCRLIPIRPPTRN